MNTYNANIMIIMDDSDSIIDLLRKGLYRFNDTAFDGSIYDEEKILRKSVFDDDYGNR